MATPLCGTTTISVAGTAVALSTTQTVRWVKIQAKVGQTGATVVGSSAVVGAASGRKGLVIPEPSADGANVVQPLTLVGPLDLAEIFIDCTTGGEVVHWMALAYP